MNKIILTDVDGVLLNWHEPFQRWVNEEHGLVGGTDPEHRVYSLATRYGIDEERMHQLVLEFNRSAAVGFLPPYADSLHYVKRLAEKGWKFITITSMGGNRYSEQLRIMNLERVFGHVFIDHNFIDLNVPKDDILRLFAGTEHWWIEDKPCNAEAGIALGLRSILLRHDHTEEYENNELLIVDRWKHIYAIITGEEYIKPNANDSRHHILPRHPECP
jgi:FMN phosphatase YigB (HAD superfamily)